MSETPTSPEEIRDEILADRMPEGFVRMAAKGFLPVPQQDLIAILVHLRRSPDEEIAADAADSLAEVPLSSIEAFARNEASPPKALNELMTIASDRIIHEALIRNKSVLNQTIVAVAEKADPRLQEVILTNQQRILSSPEILDALEKNEKLSGDAVRRIHEFREEFFVKAEARKKSKQEKDLRAAEAAAEEPDEDPLDPEAQEVLDELLAQVGDTDESEETLPVEELEKEDPGSQSAWQKILQMSVGERVQRAFKGDKTERGILIKDRNRLVCTAVIRSPRITESEIEQFAGMRGIDKEVLRLIGSNREWMRKYNIMLIIARNPKAPVGVVLPLINRLTLRDLRSLGADKGVPEVIRTNSKRLFVQRSKR